jgi:BASS family bile acid:Na+ symporter
MKIKIKIVKEYFFSGPILIGIIAGIIFPYKALELIYLNNILLFLLMLANGLGTDVSQIVQWSRAKTKETAVFLAFLFLFLPIVLINVASYLLTDANYLLGFALCCIAPTAFVAPYFCKLRGGDADQAIVNILISTLLFPIISLIYISCFLSVQHFLDMNSVVLLVFLVTILPLILSLLLNRFLPKVKQSIEPLQLPINSLLLAALMFILCGSAFNKLRPSHFLETEIIFAILLLIILDFGVYFGVRFLFSGKSSESKTRTLAISVSLRNLAIPASLLLSLQPKASIIPGLGLVIHCFFFYWLGRPKKETPVASEVPVTSEAT